MSKAVVYQQKYLHDYCGYLYQGLPAQIRLTMYFNNPGKLGDLQLG